MASDLQRLEVAAAFDARAATYDDSAMHRWQATQTAATVDARPGWSVLDVATGTGLTARALAVRMANCGRITGVDVSAGMLEVARHSSPLMCRYVRADAHHLPFSVAQFDAVVCVAAVPYLNDPAAAVLEWQRVCQPGARVVFTVPTDHGIPAFHLLQRAASAHGIALADPNANLGDQQRVADFAASAGMVCEQVTVGSFSAPFTSDPDTAWKHFLSYGFAEPLRTASPEVRDRVLDDYRRNLRAERTVDQSVEHHVLFVRFCTRGAHQKHR